MDIFVLSNTSKTVFGIEDDILTLKVKLSMDEYDILLLLDAYGKPTLSPAAPGSPFAPGSPGEPSLPSSPLGPGIPGEPASP